MAAFPRSTITCSLAKIKWKDWLSSSLLCPENASIWTVAGNKAAMDSTRRKNFLLGWQPKLLIPWPGPSSLKRQLEADLNTHPFQGRPWKGKACDLRRYTINCITGTAMTGPYPRLWCTEVTSDQREVISSTLMPWERYQIKEREPARVHPSGKLSTIPNTP